jgi:hypothetical protein
MFEGTDSVLNNESVSSNISYKSFKTFKNLHVITETLIVWTKDFEKKFQYITWSDDEFVIESKYNHLKIFLL